MHEECCNVWTLVLVLEQELRIDWPYVFKHKQQAALGIAWRESHYLNIQDSEKITRPRHTKQLLAAFVKITPKRFKRLMRWICAAA